MRRASRTCPASCMTGRHRRSPSRCARSSTTRASPTNAYLCFTFRNLLALRRGGIGKAPALDIGGRLVVDDDNIAYELEVLVPTPSILPADARQKALCHALKSGQMKPSTLWGSTTTGTIPMDAGRSLWRLAVVCRDVSCTASICEKFCASSRGKERRENHPRTCGATRSGSSKRSRN